MSTRARAGVVAASLLIVCYVVIGGLLGRTASEGAYRQLAVFSEVLSRVHSDYVEAPSLHRVTAGALHGLLAELDPYSSYLSPREYAEYQQKKALAEGQVGLVVSKRMGWISVVTVLPGSPAVRADLRTGDILESIAGFSTREMSVEQARILLAGEPGTAVKLAVVRQQRPEPRAIELVRVRLSPPRVLSRRLASEVGYLKIAAFGAGTAEEVRAALGQLRAGGADKLVVDLRDAATGSVDEAVETARLLLPGGIITYSQGQQVPRQQWDADGTAARWSGPVTVLINHGTAGPAEILAAALLDNGRGEVIGQRSYGIGGVQKLIPLEDGSALILTVAKYYSPAGKAIQDHAVTPSLPVEPPDGEALKPLPHALPPPSDPVLLKALEVLRDQSETPRVPKAA